MNCERFIKLIKNWYVQVQDEAMAPARMVDFMRAHLADCAICKADLTVEAEVKKIIEIVLPPTKIPKAVRREDEGGEEIEEYEEAGEESDALDDEDSEDAAGDTGGSDELEDEELDDPEDDDI